MSSTTTPTITTTSPSLKVAAAAEPIITTTSSSILKKKNGLYYFCQIMLFPIVFSKNHSVIFQKTILFLYFLVFVCVLYILMIYGVLPKKTPDSIVFIHSILYWILFLMLVLIFVI